MGTFSWNFAEPVSRCSLSSSPGLGTPSEAPCGAEDKAIPGRGREPSRVPQRQASGEPVWTPRRRSGPHGSGPHSFSLPRRLALFDHTQTGTPERVPALYERAEQGSGPSLPFRGGRTSEPQRPPWGRSAGWHCLQMARGRRASLTCRDSLTPARFGGGGPWSEGRGGPREQKSGCSGTPEASGVLGAGEQDGFSTGQ